MKKFFERLRLFTLLFSVSFVFISAVTGVEGRAVGYGGTPAHYSFAPNGNHDCNFDCDSYDFSEGAYSYTITAPLPGIEEQTLEFAQISIDSAQFYLDRLWVAASLNHRPIATNESVGYGYNIFPWVEFLGIMYPDKLQRVGTPCSSDALVYSDFLKDSVKKNGRYPNIKACFNAMNKLCVNK